MNVSEVENKNTSNLSPRVGGLLYANAADKLSSVTDAIYHRGPAPASSRSALEAQQSLRGLVWTFDHREMMESICGGHIRSVVTRKAMQCYPAAATQPL